MTHYQTKFKSNFILLLNLLTVAAATVSVILLAHVIAKIDDSIINNQNESHNSTKVVEDDLRCLGSFFSQKNRLDLVINNLHTCQIINTATGKTSTLALTPPVNPPTSPSSAQGSSASTNQTNTNTQDKNPTNTSQQTPIPTTPAPTPETMPLLGTPLCIPFTHVCVWQ